MGHVAVDHSQAVHCIDVARAGTDALPLAAQANARITIEEDSVFAASRAQAAHLALTHRLLPMAVEAGIERPAVKKYGDATRINGLPASALDAAIIAAAASSGDSIVIAN